MARFARVVVVDVAHHVTQRGSARQVILSSDGDRVAYFEVLRQAAAKVLRENYHVPTSGENNGATPVCPRILLPPSVPAFPP